MMYSKGVGASSKMELAMVETCSLAKVWRGPWGVMEPRLWTPLGYCHQECSDVLLAGFQTGDGPLLAEDICLFPPADMAEMNNAALRGRWPLLSLQQAYTFRGPC